MEMQEEKLPISLFHTQIQLTCTIAHPHTDTQTDNWPQLFKRAATLACLLSIIHWVQRGVWQHISARSCIYCICLQGSPQSRTCVHACVHTKLQCAASVSSGSERWEWKWGGGACEITSVCRRRWMWRGLLRHGAIPRVIKTTPRVSSGLGRGEEWRQPITIC